MFEKYRRPVLEKSFRSTQMVTKVCECENSHEDLPGHRQRKKHQLILLPDMQQGK